MSPVMDSFDFDAAVIGAGAVGLATAYALGRRGQSVVVLEREAAIGQGVSSRNSEVVHGGLYYLPGSLKARLCVAGRRQLYPFLDRHGVGYDRCGKLVVATRPEETAELDALFERAQENGVEGVQRMTASQAKALEPQLECLAAISSPESGVFDSHGYMLALQGEIESAGGAVATHAPFESAAPIAGGFRISAGGEEPATLTARRLVIAAGLGAQDAAARIEGFPAVAIPTLHLGKGVYFRLAGAAPFGRLIYPAPPPGSLGLHYRRDLGGQGVFGPDLRFVDEEDYRVDTERADHFYEAVRRFWPGLPDGALSADYAGIRPKLHGPAEAQPDFRIDGEDAHGMPGLIALFGIESPGLTSSLAIGEEVAERLA
jgi:L-2-hydroxyglutarate oxidase LhgO